VGTDKGLPYTWRTEIDLHLTRVTDGSQLVALLVNCAVCSYLGYMNLAQSVATVPFQTEASVTGAFVMVSIFTILALVVWAVIASVLGDSDKYRAQKTKAVLEGVAPKSNGKMVKIMSVGAALIVLAGVLVASNMMAGERQLASDNATATKKWSATITPWSVETYNAEADFADFKFVPDESLFLEDCLGKFEPCSEGEALVGDEGNRVVKDVFLAKVGETLVLIDSKGNQLDLAATAKDFPHVPAMSDDDSVRGKYLRWAQDNYNIKDMDFLGEDDKDLASYDVAFITIDDELVYGQVKTVVGQTVLLEKNPDKSGPDYIEYQG
jgi:hypothetical protein